MLMRPPLASTGSRSSGTRAASSGECTSATRACALQRELQRLHAALALKLCVSLQSQLGERQSALTPKMHASRDAAAHIRSLRAQARQLGERDSKVDFGSAIGQPVDLERTRPGRRHGARIIGIGSA